MLRTVLTAASAAVLLALAPVGAHAALCPDAALDFDGAAGNATADFGYYYVVTGGKNQNPGGIPNGDNASGGTFRFILDAPEWGRPMGVWTRDDWFVENAGIALTLLDDGTAVYDNNGIEDDTYGDFYTWSDVGDPPSPGLYRAYSMSNNWDWIYATVMVLDEPVTFDQAIGYFDGNGVDGAELDPTSPSLTYRFNVWSAETQGEAAPGLPHWMPSCEGFTGDVLSTDVTSAVFEVSDTGVVRQFPPGPPYESLTDPIWRVSFTFGSDVTLPAGVYVVSHDVRVAGAVEIDVRPNNEQNQINTNARQLVPIAILSADGFDAPVEVDPDSLMTRGTGVVSTKQDTVDVNDDGLEDLVVYVRARQLDKPTETECAEGGTLHLTGATYAGQSFSASDDVEFLGPDCS